MARASVSAIDVMAFPLLPLLRHAMGCLLGLVLSLVDVTDVAARSHAAGERNVIIVGGDHNYPPYEFINEEGQPDGYNTDLTRAIAEVMGVDVEIRLGNWAEIRQLLEAGEIDVLQGMAYTPDRTSRYDFSPPHAIVHQSVFARKGQAEVTDLQELRGKEVIVQESGVMHDLMLQNDVGARLIPADTHADALRMLASGKHDYALVANLPGLYLGRELELLNIQPVGKTFAARRYGYSVVKGQEELLAQFSEGLAILKNTGRQQAIYDQWLGPLEKPGVPWKKIGQGAAVVSAVLLLVLGGIVIWNRMLTREVARRAQELQVQQQKLIQADKMTSLGVLVSGVAHEINNPCSLVLMNLSMLKEVLRDSEEAYEAFFQQHGDFVLGRLPYSRMSKEIPRMLEDISTGAQRIRRIVDDLRDFARQGPVDLSESVDLNEVVAAAIRLVDSTIRKSTDHFQVRYDESAPRFRGSAQKIEQVVINLIVNACQALDSRDNAISVATQYDAAKNRLCLEVRDEGQGIEPENLSRLSDPFFTTKREQGGMGLGLSVSLSIVQEHGGTLDYDSEPGNGTRAVFSLPINPGTLLE
ncbi:histidine kinase [Litchfieldella qijiaojingensis]|uniref:histidine kinase n=1 Tax=Litchfieldella qijiaojingensis TaxID=980347 RepID=A0ABQ2YP04_9GAMM|nr:transporter substrate-binding domain-containing protein [Halomonas qijiaojingensis]GGX88110.1 histidine kinase [Halomonas qijiaojingensis]